MPSRIYGYVHKREFAIEITTFGHSAPFQRRLLNKRECILGVAVYVPVIIPT